MITTAEIVCIFLAVVWFITWCLAIYQQNIIVKKDSEIADLFSRMVRLNARYNAIYRVINKHYNQSVGHDRCHQNDTEMWFKTGIISEQEYKERYWPPVCEMRDECLNYIKSHHPDYSGQFDEEVKV